MPSPRRNLPPSLISPSPPRRGRACPARNPTPYPFCCQFVGEGFIPPGTSRRRKPLAAARGLAALRPHLKSVRRAGVPTPRRNLPPSLISPSLPCRGRACPARALPKASTPILNNSPRQPPRPHQLSARAGISPALKTARRAVFAPRYADAGPGLFDSRTPLLLNMYNKKKKAQPLAKLSFLVTRASISHGLKNNPQDCFLPPAGGRPVRFLARKHQKNSPA